MEKESQAKLEDYLIVKFKSVLPSMYGGCFALSETGEIWYFDRYDKWNRIRSPNPSSEYPYLGEEGNYSSSNAVPLNENKGDF